LSPRPVVAKFDTWLHGFPGLPPRRTRPGAPGMDGATGQPSYGCGATLEAGFAAGSVNHIGVPSSH
jgi:hypothetical protein